MYPHYFVWIDIEATGLQTNKAKILEVSIVLTDKQLIPKHHINVSLNYNKKDYIEEWSKDTHNKNGLLKECEKSEINTSKAESLLIQFLQTHLNLNRKIILFGTSLKFDLVMLGKHMPKLTNLFHYRTVDLASIIELTKQWSPSTWHNRPKGTGKHRAYCDLLDSILLLQYLHNTFIDIPNYQRTNQQSQNYILPFCPNQKNQEMKTNQFYSDDPYFNIRQNEFVDNKHVTDGKPENEYNTKTTSVKDTMSYYMKMN
tara:strand:+ start:218 stop:988 length:771 start_codon:yes stop_codon:yes gene_type:complete